MPRFTMKSLAAAGAQPTSLPEQTEMCMEKLHKHDMAISRRPLALSSKPPYLVHYRSCHLSRHRPSCFVHPHVSRPPLVALTLLVVT